MRKPLRFFLSAADQNKIEAGTVFFQPGESGFPDALRMGFHTAVADPDQLRLSLIPLTGGTMYFLPDPLAGGTAPTLPQNLGDDWNTPAWIDAEYDNWNTIGTVVIDVDGAKIRDYITTLGYESLLNEHHNFFNRQWYWPVQIPAELLKETILHLNKAEVLNKDGVKIPPGHTHWHAFAVERFLQGKYGLSFKMDAGNPADDDAISHPFPHLITEAATQYTELWIGLAVAKISVHDVNVKLVEELADSISQLNPLRNLGFSDAALLTLSPFHPANGMLSADRTLQSLRPHLEDAGQGLALADALFATEKSYHIFRFTMPGNTDEIYYLGMLPAQKIKIFNAQNELLQERRLPIHGFVAVLKTDASSSVRLELEDGILRITGKNGSAVPETDTLDIPVDQKAVTHITLQPRWPALSEAEKQENIDRISDICYGLSRNRKTKKAVRKRYQQWENKIRPSGHPGEQVFAGSRRPWSRISREDLKSVFKGLKRLSFTTADPPLCKPAEAMVLWIMEGKFSAESSDIFTKEHSLRGKFAGNFSFANTELENASEEEITDLVRVLLLWNYWGLDIMNHHQGVEDNTPALSGNLSAAIASHNDHFVNRGLRAIQSEGIVPPTRDQVNQTISVHKKGTQWFFKVEPDHQEVFVWLQYAEYLRRQSRLRQAATATGVPEAFADSPAFSYMAYNGGMEQDLVPHGWDAAAQTWRMFTTPDPPERDPALPHPNGKTTWDRRLIWKWWERVKTELETHPDTWKDKSIEDVLLKWKITNYANELNNASLGTGSRGLAVRVNGLHFALIAQTYGGVFPSVL